MTKCVHSPNFLWKIENFTSVQKRICPVVLIGGLKWQLMFSLYMEDGAEKIRLTVECLNASETLSTCQFNINVYFVYGNDDPYCLKSASYSLKLKELCVWSDSVSNFYKHFGKMDFITFLVIITPSGTIDNLFKNQGKVEEIDNESPCIKSLTEDFGNLFNSSEHSDFVLKCGDKSFQVHKGVLSARSEFFAAMFRSSMKESKEGTGKIEELEPEILELVLRYIYNGEIPEISMESLKKVYAAADRFAVEPLKVKCHSLFVESFITDSEKEFSDGSEDGSKSVKGQTEIVKTELPKNKARQLLKELFMTREWRLFCQEFPHKAQEMCKPYLLEK